MPANRSRTERYREGLQQVLERGGALEVSLAHDTSEQLPDMVWRVRLLGLGEDEMLVESPCAAGKSVTLPEGAELVGAFAIGQNRWMFRTRVQTTAKGKTPWPAGMGGGLRLAMPEKVERCSRREHQRVSMAEVHVPHTDCWHLTEPSSVVSAEAATRAQMQDFEKRGVIASESDISPLTVPVVGLRYGAKLMNVGGGGVGLLVPKESASVAQRAKLIWMRVDLRPVLPMPVGMVGKIVHAHLESTQDLYLGVSFEFAFNVSHRAFVLEQIEKYMQRLQQRHAPKKAA
jgi:hypothetical protein